jgi:hypothetical protein
VDKPPFEESLRALAARRRSGEKHPAPEELVAYRAGDLTAEEDDRIQEHLTQCRDCARLLLDLAEFEQLTPPPEELGPVDARAEASWQRLRSRLKDEEEPEEEPPVLQHRPRPRVPLWRKPAVPWALAAGLALCVVGLGLRTATLQQQVGVLSAPKIGIALVDLYPESERTTRGDAPQVEKVGASSVLFLHLPERPAESPVFETYELEVVPASGKDSVFKLPPAQGQDGSLTLQLPPTPLPPGPYTAHLYGLTGGQRQLVDQYSFEVSTEAS